MEKCNADHILKGRSMNAKINIKASFKHPFSAVDIRLKDGREFERIAINKAGELLGFIVGGQTGISESDLPFSSDDIAAYRPYWGMFARLGLRRWEQFSNASRI
jgi:hypothetical protein